MLLTSRHEYTFFKELAKYELNNTVMMDGSGNDESYSSKLKCLYEAKGGLVG
ncbi:uncharacterized protein PHALS_08392 [Plasmopara halstedii]|uniref:Uncharacterized protein n=1 Tax=Plasmopara halstedii TaxID=4781 RepID=A0A0P1ABY6_PLAHL|nr:uncharacterized protein PHALS_08392 [Plasmopara halstedii]CEG38311.1 hypothetical protein PHALS_08392 [Plasmopara halstedii]|eukprot:XP_024574680.1 hypothetical protein PHALS_08392 [Plasmopara halstedii]